MINKKDRLILLAVTLLFLFSAFCAHRFAYEPGPRVDLRTRILELASTLEGLRYRFGGADIDGFDCSGLIHYVYDCFGVKVPRTAREQFLAGKKINLSEALPADILVFRLPSGWHSAIYIGDNQILHAPGRGQEVRIEQLNSFWLKNLKRVVSYL
jgi:cell wall-associated NlpC family hydrolase